MAPLRKLSQARLIVGGGHAPRDPLEVSVMPSGSTTRSRAPKCRTCGKRIHVPKGWSVGSASRRHYWRKHPEVMRKSGGAK
ncbi:MAG: hypothetical protein ACRDKZ_02360 [Actinomycetota bacterium]